MEILELKNTISEINLLDWLNSKRQMTEERVSELEPTSLEITQFEKKD